MSDTLQALVGLLKFLTIELEEDWTSVSFLEEFTREILFSL